MRHPRIGTGYQVCGNLHTVYRGLYTEYYTQDTRQIDILYETQNEKMKKVFINNSN
jgi:hypothetical protein